MSMDSHTLIFSNIVTAAFLGSKKDLALILDLILSGVSWQESESYELLFDMFYLLN